MKKLKSQLKSIANSLSSLSQRIEKVAEQIDKPQAPKKAPMKKPTVKKGRPKQQLTVLDTVFNAIKRTKKGVTVAKLKEKTDLTPKQLSNALYKLTQQGKIEAISRGLYVKK
jgi:predicted Rossmann fold nucleotide-binding protein DprA/Smf involved in DNA uptake